VKTRRRSNPHVPDSWRDHSWILGRKIVLREPVPVEVHGSSLDGMYFAIMLRVDHNGVRRRRIAMCGNGDLSNVECRLADVAVQFISIEGGVSVLPTGYVLEFRKLETPNIVYASVWEPRRLKRERTQR